MLVTIMVFVILIFVISLWMVITGAQIHGRLSEIAENTKMPSVVNNYSDKNN